MSEPLVARVVMAWDIEEERIRGIEYSHDPSRLRLLENRRASFRGDRGTHSLEEGKDGVWRSSCRSFRRLHPLAACRHSVAAQRIDQRLPLIAEQATAAVVAAPQRQRHR